MSFGRPPSFGSIGFQPTPPDRGSFPLDHYGECKDYMKRYMDCLQKSNNTSSSCRLPSKNYLDCRMNHGLMDRDEWKNLGLANVDGTPPGSNNSRISSSSSDSVGKSRNE